MRIAGIMSGTSLDGIDVAIIDISGSGFKAKINVLTSHSVPYPRKVREALLAVSNTNAFTGDISRLNFLLGELYVEALEEAAERAEIPLDTIKLVGCHGQTFERDGMIAGSGEIEPKLLATLLRDKYFRAKPPKTAGREQYGSDFVTKLLDTESSSEDLIATATALTAESIALGVRNFVLPEMRVDEIFVSGGGTHNPTLMKMLRKALDPIPVKETSEVGLDVDAKEAIAFAVMAYETAHSRPSNVPFATGARKSVVLGKLTPNGTPQRNGTSLTATANGSTRNGSAAHTPKPTSSSKVSRPAV